MHEEELEDGSPRYSYVILDDARSCSVCGEASTEGVEDHVLDVWVCESCAADEGIL
jgi:formylmethanofuran dehydrogenase subunit E